MFFHSILAFTFTVGIFFSIIIVPECMSHSSQSESQSDEDADASWYNSGELREFELEHVECMNNTSTGKVLDFMLTINRVSKRFYAIEGEVAVDPEQLAEHQIEIVLFYSTLGNNQFTLLPYSIKLKQLCVFFNTDYRKRFMNKISKSSDIPLSKDADEDICLLFEKKIYKITNLQLGTPVLPMKTGLYKGYVNIYNKTMNVVTGIVLYFQVT